MNNKPKIREIHIKNVVSENRTFGTSDKFNKSFKSDTKKKISSREEIKRRIAESKN